MRHKNYIKLIDEVQKKLGCITALECARDLHKPDSHLCYERWLSDLNELNETTPACSLWEKIKSKFKRKKI